MLKIGIQYFAHHKGGGSTKNGRDSEAKRLGVKRADGQFVLAGNGRYTIGPTRFVTAVQISVIALFESVQPATKTPRHREPVTDVTGVAIPIKSADSALKAMEIATAVCALPRNDTLFFTASNCSTNSNLSHNKFEKKSCRK